MRIKIKHFLIFVCIFVVFALYYFLFGIIKTEKQSPIKQHSYKQDSVGTTDFIRLDPNKQYASIVDGVTVVFRVNKWCYGSDSTGVMIIKENL